MSGVLVDDRERVRTLTLNRPEALNAFNQELWQETAQAFRDAAADPSVAVVLLTGAGRAFSAGADLAEMSANVSGLGDVSNMGGFTTLMEALTDFDKPLVLAINGLGVGIGATIVGYGDLVFMSTEAKLKTPFTSLGVAPEASSSYLLPKLVGWQNAAWILMSSEWITAEQALEMGLAWRVCEPDELLDTAWSYAARLAKQPVSSLRAVKHTMLEPVRHEIEAARHREGEWFANLLGGPANREALTAFMDRRDPDFGNLDS